MLVGSYDRPIDKMEVPVELACRIGLLLDGGKKPVPDAGLAPAVKTARYRLPGAIALWQITPRRPGAEEPQDAIKNATVICSRTASLRFLGGQQWLQSLPLLVS
jgi:hypothetical protein